MTEPTTMTVTMTTALAENPTPATTLAAGAAAAGLSVLATAAWPESDADVAAPTLAGFVVSSFSPLAAEAARRCLGRRPADESTPDGQGERPDRPVTAVILVSALGDLASALHVADAVDTGGRVGPLLFFQSVPNAVAGYVATKWRLTGPVVCVGAVAAGLEIAALLIEDGDADEALLVRIEQAWASDTVTEAGTETSDRADAVLLGPGSPHSKGEET